jgi:hypothetical protein
MQNKKAITAKTLTTIFCLSITLTSLLPAASNFV